MPKPLLQVTTGTGRRKPRRINFTVEALNALQAKDGRITVIDAKVPGLACIVTQNGVRSFYLRRRVKGRSQRILIGHFPGVPIELARREAARLNGEIAIGADPMAERRQVRDEMTLGELLTSYLELHGKLHTKRWRDFEATFDRHFDGWRSRPLSHITRDVVIRWHTKKGSDAPYSANRGLELLRAMFSHAKRNGWKGENPAAGVRKFREHQRERFLGDRDPEEFKRFVTALAAEPQPGRDFFTLLLLTGARRSNVQAMRWEDISLDSRTWRIPGEVSKSGEPVTLALSDAAVEVLKRRRGELPDVAYVFPGPGQDGHYTEPKKAWAALLTRARIENLRMHDLRRTHGAILAAGGVPLLVIGKALGHKSTASTMIYARLNLDPLRGAVERVAAAVQEAAPAPPAQGRVKPPREAGGRHAR